MSSLNFKKFLSPVFKGLALLGCIFLLASCGGGGGGGQTAGGIGGTGSVASVGVANAIASVLVNGVDYSCVGATVIANTGNTNPGADDSCTRAQANGKLRPGMVVVVVGKFDKSTGASTATTVTVQSNVVGPAVNFSQSLQTFTVLGQPIDVDANTRYFLNNTSSQGTAGFGTLVGLPSPVVRVSGLPNPQGGILATYVETTTLPNGEVEVKGIVSGATGSGFNIGALNVLLNGQSAPSNGQCVEAKGTLSAGTTLTLTSLKSDNDCGGGGISGSFDKAQVEGIVSGIVASPIASGTQFKVADQTVVFTSATQFVGGGAVDLLNGVKVQAEGAIANGVLTATKIEIKSNGVRIKNGLADGPANVAQNTFTVFGITVKAVATTEFNGITLAGISAGTSLEIEGSKSGDMQITASKIKLAGGGGGGGGGGGSKPELRGPLDANPNSGNQTFQILGVPVNAVSASFQNAAGTTITSAAFFATAKANDIVKVKGTENPDNKILAEEVELED